MSKGLNCLNLDGAEYDIGVSNTYIMNKPHPLTRGTILHSTIVDGHPQLVHVSGITTVDYVHCGTDGGVAVAIEGL